MSGGATAPAQLLKLNDGEFNSTIQDMSVKQLLETITYIQKEMGREQENFNSLSAELGNLKKNSGQYKSVSKDMAASQRRLTTLMDRSMKCFSQQGQQQSKETSSQKSVSQNRNSTELVKAKTEKPSINPFVEMKPLKSVEKRVSSPSQEQVSSMSFAEAKNRFSGNSQNGSANNAGKPKVPADVKRTQSMGSTVSSKRWSADVTNGISVDSKPKGDIGNNKPDNKVVTSTVDHVTSSNVSTKQQKPASTTTLAPLANQNNKFLSKSSDNVFSQSSNKFEENDVVKGSVSNSKPMIVMTADRQYLDLDSFTDRKNLLTELKSFNKDLKPVAKTDPQTKDHAIEQPNLIKSFGFHNVKQDNETSVQKVSLLNDIRLGKKPSDVKNGEVEKAHNKYAVNLKDQAEVQKTIPSDIKKTENGYKGVDEVDSIKMIDAVLDNVKATSETEALTSEITVTNEKEALPGSSQSEDSESQSSELSEDEDKFVSEFSFPQKQAVPQSLVKTAPSVGKPGPTLKVIPEHETRQKQNKPDGQNNKQAPKQGIESGAQAIKNAQAKVHVVKDNEEVLGAALGNQPEYNEDGEELVKQTRVNYSNWDPSLLLAELYRVNYMPDNIEDISHKFIGMEGLMEKLPMNKKKATLLKTWKRRFFRAKDGWLHYYETSSRDKPSDSLQLMGGRVEELGNRVLGVDDGRGKYLMVRVPTEHEYGQWKVALESQTADNVKATYVRPAPASAPNPKKKVIVIDIGSSGIRAGILGERATLPHVFFPSVVAINKKTKGIVVGADAYVPDTRQSSDIIYPIRPTNKVDKGIVQAFNIDMDVMSAVVKKVFSDLRVNPKEYLVMLSTPQNLGNTLKEGLMRILINQNHVKGVCMVQQALLALYSYNAMSGIIVDIGERLEILPIYEGLLIESGLSHQAYGGTKIQDSMYTSLLQNRYQFLTPIGRLVVRYICEQTCHVVDKYKDAKTECDKDSTKYTRTVDLQNFQLPQGAHQSVTLDHACFKSAEGFFNTDLWEMDYKNIQKQIFAAIQQCPMDSRKQMYRSIYLSGGVTMIPGFAERLQLEMEKLAPPAAVVEVHASPQRYHAAYIGACAVALMDVFEMSCVMADEWNKLGVQACRKWGTN